MVGVVFRCSWFSWNILRVKVLMLVLFRFSGWDGNILFFVIFVRFVVNNPNWKFQFVRLFVASVMFRLVLALFIRLKAVYGVLRR